MGAVLVCACLQHLPVRSSKMVNLFAALCAGSALVACSVVPGSLSEFLSQMAGTDTRCNKLFGVNVSRLYHSCCWHDAV